MSQTGDFLEETSVQSFTLSTELLDPYYNAVTSETCTVHLPKLFIFFLREGKLFLCEKPCSVHGTLQWENEKNPQSFGDRSSILIIVNAVVAAQR